MWVKIEIWFIYQLEVPLDCIKSGYWWTTTSGSDWTTTSLDSPSLLRLKNTDIDERSTTTEPLFMRDPNIDRNKWRGDINNWLLVSLLSSLNPTLGSSFSLSFDSTSGLLLSLLTGPTVVPVLTVLLQPILHA